MNILLPLAFSALPDSSEREARRVREAYDRQEVIWRDERFRSWHPGNLFINQELERVMLALLRQHGYLPLADKRILDVGCGAGKTLLNLQRYGGQPQNLYGVDLLEDKVDEANRIAPHLSFAVADAANLPFDDGFFDLVLVFTLFSSIADPARRQLAADEIGRTVSAGGAVLWYDFSVENRSNPDNVAIGLKEARRLFDGFTVHARRVTLAPPIARTFAGRSWLLSTLLATVPFLRTHWFALITRA